MTRAQLCRAAAVVALAVALGACAPGSSVVAVTVTVAAGTQLPDVHHFSVSLRDVVHGKKVAPFPVALPSLVSLPPAQRFNLGFDSNVNGAVILHVDAVRADGTTLAGSDTTITVKPSQSTSATVTLPGVPASYDGGDLGAGDMPPHGDAGVLTLTEAMVTLDAQPSAAATHTFVAMLGGADVSSLATFTVVDPTLGTMQGATFKSAATRGGTSTIAASYLGATATATVTVRFHASITSGCAGCTTFPADGAAACATAAQPTIVYPLDGTLWPPNLGALEVQLTPGAGDTQLELDFANSVTDVRVASQCVATMDQTGTASGGCQVDLDGATWDYIARSNRDGDPVTLTVRATTDGQCASPSTNTARMMFAADDLTAAIYYTELPIAGSGASPTHGVIARKDFANRAATKDVALSGATCYGCHFVARDGTRLSVSSLAIGGQDDAQNLMDSELYDLVKKTTLGPTTQPTGFQSFAPDHSYYVASDGIGSGTTNQFFLLDGNTGTSSSFAMGPGGARPTQPDWSPDGSRIVFVIPMQAGYATTIAHPDDTHIFGGSLYTASVSGTSFGSATPLITSAGENNYYPSFSPDGAWIVFNQVSLTGTVATITNCNTGGMAPYLCPNDSFFNPNAWLLMMPAGGGQQVTLSSAGMRGTYPRWVPQVTSYKGQKIAWLSFASLRDYGLRVRNQLSGQVICYPPDSPENPNTSHQNPWPGACQEPQIWMAGVILNAAAAKDPSFPSFWVPYQDPTKHNIMADWATTYAP
jgi:hypothetical protein